MAIRVRDYIYAGLALALLTSPVGAVDKDQAKRAIEAGVRALRAKQSEGGFWVYGDPKTASINSIGSTALAGMTLLECGVSKDDEAVQKAAQGIRMASIDLTHTYSLSVSIMFLDRLGDPDDGPFIKSMANKLAGGQLNNGMWTYVCPVTPPAERTTLVTALTTRRESVAAKKDDSSKPKRDYTTAVELQLKSILSASNREIDLSNGTGDNSNTQFALMALWIARRHDCPVEKSLVLVEKHFRATQNLDGGWGYKVAAAGRGPAFAAGNGMSTPSMTCSGLLGLAVGNVASGTSLKTRGSKDKSKADTGDRPRTDLSKDRQVLAGIAFIGTTLNDKLPFKPGPNIGIGGGGPGGLPSPIKPEPGPNYYLLWSLERVAVAYSLDAFGGKDWYEWGANKLLPNQDRDGTWNGASDLGGVSTSFSLLFLSQSNLVRDLTTALKAGRGGAGDRAVAKPDKGGRKTDQPTDKPEDNPSEATEKNTHPANPAPSASNSERTAAQMSKELLTAPAEKRDQLLDEFRQAKGSEYTDSLAKAIRELDGESKKKARQALADRLTMMSADTLGDKLSDSNSEIRRAAAIAAAMKEDKTQIPRLIHLLEDSESAVNRAAYAALKSLSGQDFGPDKGASPEQIVKAVGAWTRWWQDNGGK